MRIIADTEPPIAPETIPSPAVLTDAADDLADAVATLNGVARDLEQVALLLRRQAKEPR